MNEEIFKRLCNVIVKMKEIDARKITPEARLREDLGIDSVDIWDIATRLEEEFEIEIGDYEGAWVKTIEDLSALIERKILERPKQY